MGKRLIFVHGRAQEDKDAVELKKAWLASLKKGLDANGQTLALPESHIHFMYFGDALRDLCEGKEQVADVIMRGTDLGEEAKQQLQSILEEFVETLGIDQTEIDAELQAESPDDVNEKGPQNWRWVQAVIRAIDKHVPGAGALIALATNDVHQYLSNDGLRMKIEDAIVGFMKQEDQNIIVSHSLGTIVTYRLLQRLSKAGGWQVPLLVTVGSPLGVHSIRDRLRPIGKPTCVGDWFNAFDSRDVVALNPLDAKNFPTNPQIRNHNKVDNQTSNRHGIVGYLNDKLIADAIYQATRAP